ncbi:MAG TPA: signal peptidase II [Verrucomicrobiae bacterium]|nr:signal peptidase II [Verrucomicrobiae bacterium]
MDEEDSRDLRRRTPWLARWLKAGLLIVVASTIGCDQVSKRVAALQLQGVPSRSFLGDLIRLQYAENAGAFLSLGADLPLWVRTAFFTVATGAALALCLVAISRSEWVGLSQVGLALIVGGGASNLIDRVGHGVVVDFLNVGIGPLRTGIFNVADMAIMLGVTLLVVGWFRGGHGVR